jgi:hypothetical protein
MKRKIGIGLAPLVLLALVVALPPASGQTTPATGMVCTDGPTFDLETATGYVYTPDGNSVFMWGYKPSGGAFQMPGPVLCVTQGQTVTINLSNPAGTGPGEPVSMIFPGQIGVTASGGSCPAPEDCLFAARAADVGGTVTYTFTAGEPGTYLYESGTEPDKQVQMGLYGALIVRPGLGDNFAYNDASTEFDPAREYLIILNEIDPDLHRLVELGRPTDISNLHPGYWQVNGRSFPDTIADNGVSYLPSQPYGSLVVVEPCEADDCRALIRYANAGSANHPFHPHGNHLRVIARDGRLLRGPGGEDTSFENFTRTIGSGQTYDLLFRWTAVDAWITSNDPPAGITIPGNQNLVFKDDATFYSGDPNLGQQGELPVGVTSYNECGEFYFPWHSHALFEFTNFDEGFGGLATLLRVEPPGGCGAVVDSMHVGNLEGSGVAAGGPRWRALVTITVHDFQHDPVAGATVTGTWSGGDTNGVTTVCTTDGTGQCGVQSGRLSLASDPDVAFTVQSVTGGLTYLPSANHDPDADSTGTSIVVGQP